MSNSSLRELRIKRKRTEDPIKTLVIEDRKVKRSKSTHFVYKLAKTDEKGVANSKVLVQTANTKNPSHKTFSLGKGEEKEPEVTAELLDMVNEYLNIHKEENTSKPLKRRQSTDPVNTERPNFSSSKEENGSSDYVYDVYYIDKVPLSSTELSNPDIGYLKLADEDLDLIPDEDSDDEFDGNYDDEDSNSENYFANDYPEDEDGGYDDEEYLDSEERTAEEEDELDMASDGDAIPSDDQDDQYQIAHDRKKFKHDDYVQENGLNSDSQFSSLYEDMLKNSNAGPINLLDNLSGSQLTSANAAEDADDEEYEKQNFFPGEEDDELANYRDKIFHRLNKMIQEKDDQK
ncbi:hypothetical protein B5S28_g1969 [[Candida] boidinii]|nr:hypothetical protein B5S28_g1969 [[Candida] boidinii]